MTSQFKNLIFLIWGLCFFTSCQKEESNMVLTLDEIWECHDQQTWDDTKFKNKLVGIWKWQEINCPFDPANQPSTSEFEGLTLEFTADNILIVRQFDAIQSEVSWELQASLIDTPGSGSFSYQVLKDPIIMQINGIILFCEDTMLFTDSYRDGCDNRFIKIN